MARKTKPVPILEEETEVKVPVYRMPGRPPKSPKNLIRTSIRCLVTVGVYDALGKLEALHGVTRSNLLRLALYRQLEQDGLMTAELRRDATWDELRHAGLV